MITYKKKSLKCHLVKCHQNEKGYYVHALAQGIKEFIEKGDYSRIADIMVMGEGVNRVACIIYQEAAK